MAATIVVTTNADETNTNGRCALREAVRNANQDLQTTSDCPAGSGADTIVVPSGLFIKLTQTGTDDAALNGDLDITAPVTITGGGPLTTAVNGNQSHRVFDIRPGVTGTVTISGLRIENGRVVDQSGGGILNQATLVLSNSLVTGNNAHVSLMGTFVFGGGIRNMGTLTVSGSSVSGNSTTGAAGSGGGIAQTGGGNNLTIVDSTISGNSTLSAGGGIYENEGASVTIQNSTVSGNSATAQAGGLFLFGNSGSDYNLANVTIADNSSVISGGGVYLNDEAGAELTQLRVLRNRATGGRGGGIWIAHMTSETILLRSSRISRNTSSQGGGGLSVEGTGGGVLYVDNTTVDGNNGTDGDGVYTTRTNGSLQIFSSTISGNGISSTTGTGGGIYTAAGTTTLLANVTLEGNSAGTSSGAAHIHNGGVMSASNTAVNNAVTGGNCGGTAPINLNNLEPLDGTGLCGWTLGFPRFKPLRDNGGPTPTHAVPQNSSARNAGQDCTPSDQRGVPRSLGGRCDIGAYELVRCLGGIVNRVGTAGDDRMVDGGGSQVYLTLGGSDFVKPGKGADRVCAGGGRDTVDLRDGSGTDRADGGPGTDRVRRDGGDSVVNFERIG